MSKQSTEPSLLELILSSGVTVDHEDFNRLVLEATDHSLDEILGKRTRIEFYDQLERNYYFGKGDIPKRLGDFLMILERTFGKDSKVIERAIVRHIVARTG